jgi:hypothetical protein
VLGAIGYSIGAIGARLGWSLVMTMIVAGLAGAVFGVAFPSVF